MTDALADADVRGAPIAPGRLAVILLHGRDQDPDWMYDHVVARMPALSVTWAAPAAPGRAWYAGRVHDPLESTRAERERAGAAVDALAATLPGPAVLAGFSQGACLVADHLLRRPRRWAGAVIWTGAAFGPPGTRPPPPGASLDGLPVLVSNGDDDAWVPWSATASLAATLRSRGAEVTLMQEVGRGHEVTDREVAAAADLLRRVSG